MKSLSFNRSVLFVIVRRRMETRLLLILFFSALACHTGADLPRPISVKNGGVFGDWGPLRVCPIGTRATAFSIKVEEESWFDNTALNGIKLYCGDKNSTETVIESTTEKWGVWGPRIACNQSSFLVAFSLRVQPLNVNSDETAANDINFLCSNNITLYGDGMTLGAFGDWSEPCNSGICAIETRVQEQQGAFSDDTALNNVNMYCCP